MTFYPNDRIALFIDGANLYSAAKNLGFDIDYKKLSAEFRTRGVLVRAYYYTALVEDRGLLADPAAGRLAGLQRLHAGDEDRARIHRSRRAASAGAATWTSRSPST